MKNPYDYKRAFMLIIALILLTVICKLTAQENISLSIHQDARLLILGDDIGNNPGTLNLLTRLKLNGKQDRLGYATITTVFEIANIEGNYKRYSAEVGYTFNEWSNNFEASLYVGWGWIDRWGKSYFSGNANAELSYKISNTLKVSLLAQFTERKDLKYRYNDSVIRMSGFIGTTINLR